MGTVKGKNKRKPDTSTSLVEWGEWHPGHTRASWLAHVRHMAAVTIENTDPPGLREWWRTYAEKLEADMARDDRPENKGGLA